MRCQARTCESVVPNDVARKDMDLIVQSVYSAMRQLLSLSCKFAAHGPLLGISSQAVPN